MNDLEKVLDQLVAGDEDKAKETFHNMVVQQSRDEFNKLEPQETPQVTPATSGYGNDGGLNAPTPTKSKGPVETFMDFLPPIPDFYEIHKNLFKPKSSLNNFSEIGMIPEEDEDISEELVMAFASGIAANYGGTGQIQYVPVPIEIPGETFIASGPTPHWGYSLQTG
mgnify:CR=1 FL=1